MILIGKIAGGLLVLAGVIMLSIAPFDDSSTPWNGIVVAICGAICLILGVLSFV